MINESRVRAPQLPTDPGLWLNTNGSALSLTALRGCVVLLAFWRHGSIDCLRALPDLKAFQTRYANRPFVVIGVHAGKFEGEKNGDSVRHALLRYDIDYPVARDDDHLLWQAYDAHAWPTFGLIDPDGYYLGSVSGEAQRDELNRVIEGLLNTLTGTPGQAPPRSFASEQTPDTPLAFPGGILASSQQERLFIADTGHHRLIVCAPDGGNPQIIGSGRAGKADGDWATASFLQPQGMALVGDALFVCDTGNHRLRRVDLARQTVTTITAGEAPGQARAPGGSPLKISPASPFDVCYNPAEDGILYVTMAGARQIWRYDLHTGDMKLFAGSGREARVDGPLLRAAFARPGGIATDGRRLYVADSESGSIRRIRLEKNLEKNWEAQATVETLAGGDLFAWGDVDGVGATARFQYPLGIVAYGELLYVADTFNHKIRVANPVTQAVTTLAGTGRAGHANGPGQGAQFFEPGGISAADGKLYIADANNHCIRTLNLTSGLVSTLELPDLEAPIASPPGR